LQVFSNPRVPMNRRLLVFVFLMLFVCTAGGALATRLSPDITKASQTLVPDAKVRLDGALQGKHGELYVLLLPAKASAPDKGKVDSVFPEKGVPEVILYSNGMAHVKVQQKGDAAILPLLMLPEKFKKAVGALHFPSDLIVPQGFVMPRSFKSMTVDVPTVSLLDDGIILSPEFGQKRKAVSRAQYKGSGSVFLTSITAGSITMLDGKSLNKVAEFPTEGTPCSMELVNGQLYVVDQAKNRVLILDPAGRKFAGQIDLAAKSAPKGIAALANGKWMYVSESASSDIAVIELDSGKVLMRTKVKPGPGRIALTPDGVYLIVLNVTSGEVSVISTYNQKVVSTVKVGDMPTSLAVSSDSKYAYITNRMSNTVSVLDIGKRAIVSTLKVGQGPTAVALMPDNSKLFVACGRDNTITVYDTTGWTQSGQMHLPVEIEFPGSLCMLPDGKRLLVSGQQGQTLGIIDTEKMELSRSANLGHAHHEAVWVPAP
jgi:YVTN family beta-propeller protein